MQVALRAPILPLKKPYSPSRNSHFLIDFAFRTRVFPLKTEEMDMGQFEQFAAILEKKIRQDIEAEMREIPQFPSENAPHRQEIDSGPLGMSWMMGQLGKHQFTPTNKSSEYHRHRKPPKPRPPHTLSEAQSEAFKLLRHYVSELSESFTKAELKKAYHSALFHTHPDRGGTSAKFLAVKTAYQLLSVV